MSKSTHFLHDVPKNEFEILADIIRDKGGFNCSLNQKEDYDNYYNYVEATINELLDYGSITFASQETYNVVLKDVCDKMKVKYTSTEDMGEALLEKMVSSIFEKLNDDEKREFINNVFKNEEEKKGIFMKGGGILFAALFKAGGFASYQLSLIIANNIARMVLGRGLSLAANAALTRVLSFVSGPLALLMAAWTVKEIAGPAYRVTVPAVVYIEALRSMMKARESGALSLQEPLDSKNKENVRDDGVIYL